MKARPRPTPITALSKSELERRLREATMLKQIVATSGAPLEPLTVLNVICSELVAVVGVQHAGFARMSEDGHYLTVVAEFGLEHRTGLNERIPLKGNVITQKVIKTRKPIAVLDAQNDPRMGAGREAAKHFGVVSMLIVPILAGERVVGTLGLDSYEPRRFGRNEIALVEAVSRAASPLLENAHLFDQLKSELAERQRAEEELRKSRTLYQELVNSLEGVVWEAEFHKDSLVFTFVSRQIERVLGYGMSEFLGPREKSVWPRVLYPSDFEQVAQRLRTLAITLETAEVEYRALDRDGRLHWFQDRISALREVDGTVRLRGLIVDVTDHKRAVRLERDRNLALELIARGAELEDILEVLMEMLASQLPEVACAIQVLKSGRVRFAASANLPETLRKLFEGGTMGPLGYRVQEGEASVLDDLEQNQRLKAATRQTLLRAGYRSALTLPVISKDNVLGALTVLSPTPLEPDVRAAHIVADLAAIAVDRQGLIEQLEYQATHDPLTKLPNRMLYQQRLAQAMQRAEEKGRLVGVLYIDLDNFKKVNDTFSHATGDELLRSVARQLASAVRPSDTVARLGGDEFGVILADLPSVEMAERIARKLGAEVNTSVRIGNRALEVTASIGLALYPRDGTDADALYRHADREMYAVKGKLSDQVGH
ncbi:diguanylate cyclase domain-containing protein [Calidithermus roseus]|uniref:Cyclic di-GMP phosphodiesterase Gmr n=1 Tax=Calidithermus roseus TaxID=1644118 RepID=A0A399EUL7_9DEIN|nr:diguanylate cyclase [Calidithermus roseus]RIH87176.1 Cyclic di-GMP phosphodiesterase Gmr [Calidithermus roseus]